MKPLLVVLASFAPALGCQEPAADRSPPGRWYTEGGNAARTAASAERPLLRRPAIAWRQELPGTLTGEPLVWDDHVVLGLRLDEKRTAVEVRRLEDGAVVGRREKTSAVDPSPTLWGAEVVWRYARSLELVRIRAGGLEFVKNMRGREGVGPAVRVGTKVYAVVDGRLTCMRAADFRVLWQSDAAGFVGRPSVGGERVFAVRAEAGGFAVVSHGLADGKAADASRPFPLRQAPADELLLQVYPNKVQVRFGEGTWFETRQQRSVANGLRLGLPLTTADLQLAQIPLPHATDGEIEIGTLPVGRETCLALFRRGEEGAVRLDVHPAHRALASVPPTLLHDVFYLGACAVDRSDLRILWQLGDGEAALPRTRAIPAGRTLLLAGERELVALRASAAADPVANELLPALRAGQRTRVEALVDKAIGARDWALAGDLLDRARALGADADWAKQKEVAIEAGAKKRRQTVDAALADSTRAQLAGVEAAALGDVRQQVVGWQDTRPALDFRRGLRFVLERDPADPAVAAVVRGMLPAGIEPAVPFQTGDWLDFLAAAAHTKVEFLDAALEEFASGELDPITRQCKQQLLEWRDRWRPDLQALRSGRLVLYTPVTQPGSLAKALATGELTCELLERMFAHMPQKRHDPRPMSVFVYSDQEDYLAEAKKAGFGDVEWTAGFYSPSDRRSRLFVPGDDVGFARVLPTLAHELTHQWLMDRCPAFEPHAAAAAARPRGFWIVEGFAGLVEQFEFDFEQREYRLGGGSLRRADLVASAERRLIPWPLLVGMNGTNFDRMSRLEKPYEILSQLQLGSGYRTPYLGLFYAQSAMLARYLYDGDGGRHRQRLLEFVAAYYDGDADRLDFAQAFGDPKELGQKVVEYSKSLLP